MHFKKWSGFFGPPCMCTNNIPLLKYLTKLLQKNGGVFFHHTVGSFREDYNVDDINEMNPGVQNLRFIKLSQVRILTIVSSYCLHG